MTEGFLSGLFSQGPSEQTVTQLETTLDGRLEPDEQLQYRLPGSSLVHESADGSEAFATSDGALAAVTDHRLLFVARSADGEQVLEVPHTDISAVDLDSGLFRTSLTVECWDDGVYRFRPAGGATADAVAYIERASECWQFVETLLDELDGHAQRIENHLEAEQFDQATAVLEDARETADELYERVSAAGLEKPLGDRVSVARRDLQRRRVRVRTKLARSLVADAEAKHVTDEGGMDYTGAYEQYTSASEHLSAALDIAREHGIEPPAETVETRELVDDRLKLLARQPVAMAKQATERALETDHLDVKVETMQAALGHYRDALAIGWGRGLEPAQDRDEVQFRIELLADGLVDARREYASSLEAAGDALAADDDTEGARERYRDASEQLAAALDLAREFRAPEPAPLERERARIERKADELTAS